MKPTGLLLSVCALLSTVQGAALPEPGLFVVLIEVGSASILCPPAHLFHKTWLMCSTQTQEPTQAHVIVDEGNRGFGDKACRGRGGMISPLRYTRKLQKATHN